MNNTGEKTLASIVTGNHEVVPVLEKYHLDFCCKGKRTLAQACLEEGLTLEYVLNDIEKISESEQNILSFTEMKAAQLIDYIVTHHHFYVIETMPVILGHLEKVALKHGERYPYMKEVFQIFINVADELTLHLKKEELVLFPRILEVSESLNLHEHVNIDLNYIQTSVNVMESEHDHAGEAMCKIRQLTSNYIASSDVCITFLVVLEELKAFEEDLHKHVHLENNILFPLAKRYFA